MRNAMEEVLYFVNNNLKPLVKQLYDLLGLSVIQIVVVVILKCRLLSKTVDILVLK